MAELGSELPPAWLCPGVPQDPVVLDLAPPFYRLLTSGAAVAVGWEETFPPT